MTQKPEKNEFYRMLKVLPALENSHSARGQLLALAYHSASILNAEAALVYIADRTGRSAALAASWVKDPIPCRTGQPPNPLADWVLLHRRSKILSDTELPQRLDAEAEFNSRIKNLVIVPVIARKRVIGALEIINCPEAPQKQEEEMLLHLSAFAANNILQRQPAAQKDHSRLLVQHIRTPLTTLNTIAYLLDQPDLEDPKRLELAAAVKAGSSRLNETIDVYEEINDLEEGRTLIQKRNTDVVELIRSACRKAARLAADRNIRLSCSIVESLPSVDLDAAFIEKALLQLLINAILFNRKGGRVFLTAWTEGGNLRVQVQDNGNGIPAGDLPKVFDRFYRARNAEKSAPGTGLGLSLSKSIIQAHGGEISINSRLGSGTGVTVSLPLEEIL